MVPKSIVHLVACECKPGLESEVGKWYLEEHFPALLQFKGLREATVCKRLYEKPDYPTFLAIYKFDNQSDFEAYEASPELAKAKEDTAQRWKEEEFHTKWRLQFEIIGTKTR